ncbi:MAG: hypothetical protein ACR2QW_09300 [bacterium]
MSTNQIKDLQAQVTILQNVVIGLLEEVEQLKTEPVSTPVVWPPESDWDVVRSADSGTSVYITKSASSSDTWHEITPNAKVKP